MKSFFKKNRSFILGLTALLVVRGSFADQYFIPSGSMEPTIAVGDRILVSKLAYDLRLPFSDLTLAHTGAPERGDIIVFFNPVNGMRMIKRVVGLPGDRIHIENGFVAVNGQPIPGTAKGIDEFNHSREDEVIYQENLGAHQAQVKRTHTLFRPESRDFKVLPDHYFAMGDNRDNSLDSRSWGFVPRSHIQGRALGVIVNLALWPQPRVDLARVAMKF